MIWVNSATARRCQIARTFVEIIAIPTFITQGRYTPEAMRGMLSHPDDDRTESLVKLFAASGGKLLAYYMTFGDYDFIVISEGPYEGVAPSSIVTAASGTVVELKTTIAVPASDMKTLFSRAGKLAAGFTPAGVGPAANA